MNRMRPSRELECFTFGRFDGGRFIGQLLNETGLSRLFETQYEEIVLGQLHDRLSLPHPRYILLFPIKTEEIHSNTHRSEEDKRNSKPLTKLWKKSIIKMVKTHFVDEQEQH